MITLEKAKDILGDKSKDMSDKQIIQVVETLTKLANIIIDNYMAMTPEQRKEISDKYDKEQLEKRNKVLVT